MPEPNRESPAPQLAIWLYNTEYAKTWPKKARLYYLCLPPRLRRRFSVHTRSKLPIGCAPSALPVKSSANRYDRGEPIQTVYLTVALVKPTWRHRWLGLDGRRHTLLQNWLLLKCRSPLIPLACSKVSRGYFWARSSAALLAGDTSPALASAIAAFALVTRYSSVCNASSARRCAASESAVAAHRFRRNLPSIADSWRIQCQ